MSIQWKLRKDVAARTLPADWAGNESGSWSFLQKSEQQTSSGASWGWMESSIRFAVGASDWLACYEAWKDSKRIALVPLIIYHDPQSFWMAQVLGNFTPELGAGLSAGAGIFNLEPSDWTALWQLPELRRYGFQLAEVTGPRWADLLGGLSASRVKPDFREDGIIDINTAKVSQLHSALSEKSREALEGKKFVCEFARDEDAMTRDLFLVDKTIAEHREALKTEYLDSDSRFVRLGLLRLARAGECLIYEMRQKDERAAVHVVIDAGAGRYLHVGHGYNAKYSPALDLEEASLTGLITALNERGPGVLQLRLLSSEYRAKIVDRRRRVFGVEFLSKKPAHRLEAALRTFRGSPEREQLWLSEPLLNSPS